MAGVSIKSPRNLKRIVNEILRSYSALNKPDAVWATSQPIKSGRTILGYETACWFQESGIRQIRVSHFYGFEGSKDYVFVESARWVESSISDEQVSALEKVLQKSNMNAQVTPTHVQFHTDPTEQELRKALNKYFTAEEKVLKTYEKYRRQLETLRV